MEKNTEKQNVKRRSTFAVLFYINRTKVRKDGMCQLLCKVSIDAEWAQIGTKVSVNPGITTLPPTGKTFPVVHYPSHQHVVGFRQEAVQCHRRYSLDFWHKFCFDTGP